MTPLLEDDPRLIYVPWKAAIVPPPGLIEHLKDKFWCVHPLRGLIYFKIRKQGSATPQCNNNINICTSIRDQLYTFSEVKFAPSVFRRINPHDYI